MDEGKAVMFGLGDRVVDEGEVGEVRAGLEGLEIRQTGQAVGG